MKYRCRRCGGTFDEPDALIEPDGFPLPPWRYTYACPYCHDPDYNEEDDDDDTNEYE